MNLELLHEQDLIAPRNVTWRYPLPDKMILIRERLKEKRIIWNAKRKERGKDETCVCLKLM